MIEKLNKFELQKLRGSLHNTSSNVPLHVCIADSGTPELKRVPQSITNLILKEAREILKSQSAIIKGYGETFHVSNVQNKNEPYKVFISLVNSKVFCKSKNCY